MGTYIAALPTRNLCLKTIRWHEEAVRNLHVDANYATVCLEVVSEGVRELCRRLRTEHDAENRALMYLVLGGIGEQVGDLVRLSGEEEHAR